MNKLHTSVDAGVVLGVPIVILNMNTGPNTNVVDFTLHKPPILLPLPRIQSTLPHELVLVRATILEVNLHMRMDGRTQSGCFAQKSVTHLFRCILIAARLFPQKISGTKVLETRSISYAARVLIKYRADKLTLTKSFSSPIFDTFNLAKLDACSAACA